MAEKDDTPWDARGQRIEALDGPRGPPELEGSGEEAGPTRGGKGQEKGALDLKERSPECVSATEATSREHGAAPEL